LTSRSCEVPMIFLRAQVSMAFEVRFLRERGFSGR